MSTAPPEHPGSVVSSRLPVVLLTRPAPADPAFAQAIRDAGYTLIEAPAVEFADCGAASQPALAERIRRLDRAGGWLILPSPTAVRRLDAVLARLRVNLRTLAGVRLAVVGDGSAAVLATVWGRPPDFISARPTGAGLADTLPADPRQPILIVGSSQSREELPRRLRARRLLVESIAIYDTRPCVSGLATLTSLLESTQLPRPAVIVASPSAVDAIAAHVASKDVLARAAWVTIGPTTHARLLHAAFPARALQADSPRPADVVRALARLDSIRPRDGDVQPAGPRP